MQLSRRFDAEELAEDVVDDHGQVAEFDKVLAAEICNVILVIASIRFGKIAFCQFGHIPIIRLDMAAASKIEREPLFLHKNCPREPFSLLNFPRRNRPIGRVTVQAQRLGNAYCRRHHDPFEGSVAHVAICRSALHQHEECL